MNKSMTKSEKKLLESIKSEGGPVSVSSEEKRRFDAAKKLVARGLAVWTAEPKTCQESVPVRSGGFGGPTIWIRKSYVHGSVALPGCERKGE